MDSVKHQDEFIDPHGTHDGKFYDRTQESKYRVKNNNFPKQPQEKKISKKYHKKGLMREQIYRELQAESHTITELIRIFDRTHATIFYHITKLLEKRLIEKTDKSHYRAIIPQSNGSKNNLTITCDDCNHRKVCKIIEVINELNQKAQYFTSSKKIAQLCNFFTRGDD